MTTNFRQFRLALRKFEGDIGRLHTQFMQKLSLDFLRGVVFMSPVKDGRFRNNWMTQIGTPSDEVTDEVDPSGAKAISRGAQEIEQLPQFSAIYLTNNVPYARRLEEGYSQRAPAGVVQVTFTNITSVL